MAELDDATHDEIKDLCAQGDTLAEARDYPQALEHYWKAWDLLPEPKTDWEAATWILAAVGDANFLCGDFEAGRDNLANVMHCPDAIGNPFLHMRLGQCQYELGNLDRAADELTRAMMIAGEEILLGENPEYWTFLKSRLKAPAAGWADEPKPKRPRWKIW